MPATSQPNGQLIVAPSVRVSPLDTRSYRALTLPNELDVLLVSDLASDEAAASLDVAVGSYSDPEQLPGLAHFLEHMLFLGTEKYPDEGSYNAFLAENGGMSNAYTAPENTNFHFNMHVSDRHEQSSSTPRFREALDRFSQFFIAPLFTESATDRELNAVHSEHQKNLQSDGRRLNQVKNTWSNPEHPLSKFSTGSRETLFDTPQNLGIDTRAQLLEFYRTYYSANLMKLCVVGPYPLDVLQNWIVNLFSPIPNYKRANPCEEYRHIQPYLDEHLKLMFHISSVCDIRLLEMSWVTPSYIDDHESKSARIVATLLGDEGEGSLLSLLKERGWCDRLGAGPLDSNTFGKFIITVSLTPEGINHTDEIITTVYQYIRMLRKGGIPKRIYDEEAGLGDITFRFREREGSRSLVSRMSSKMHYLPPVEYLSGQYLFSKYDEKKIKEVVDLLIPENCVVMVTGKFIEKNLDKVEKWYETPYHVEHIDDERLKRWSESDIDKALHLPPANQFIPHDFDLVSDPLPVGEKDNEGPKVIKQNDHFILRHKLDKTFRRPRARIVLKLMTPVVYASPWHSVMGNLLTLLLEDSLTEYAYPAEQAGFGYEIDITEAGLELNLRGYSHRIDVLLDAVLRKLVSFEADPNRFEVQRDVLERRYANFAMAQPYQHAMYSVNYLLEEPRWHTDDYLSIIRSGRVSIDKINSFAKMALSRLWVSALVCGNISEDAAISMVQKACDTINYDPLPRAELPARRVVQLPLERDVFTRIQHPNNDDNNSAIMVFFQVGPGGDPKDDVRVELLSEILNRPTFHELRTVQQLGYIVFEGTIDNDNVGGIFVIIQSTVADPDELLSRIDKFLLQVRKEVLEDMEEDKFNDYVKALVTRKAEPDRTIGKQAHRFWGEIDDGFLMFDRKEREIEALQNVTKEEVVQLFDDHIAVGGSKRRCVISQVFGNEHPFDKRKDVPEKAIEVEDALEFRRSSPLHGVLGRIW